MTAPNDPRLPWEDVLAERVKELLRPGAPPVYSYTTGGASTVTGPVTVDRLLALVRPLQQQKDETDRRLVAGLKDAIRESGGTADEWADRLEIDRGKFARVLAGAALRIHAERIRAHTAADRSAEIRADVVFLEFEERARELAARVPAKLAGVGVGVGLGVGA